MVGVDTNIIIRFLTQDNEEQFKKSLAIFKKQDVFIPDTVILEVEWVLRYAYKFEPISISKAFTKLFGLSNVYLSNATLIAQAISWYTEGMDFADALHLVQSEKKECFYTFDKKFINKSKSFQSCPVLLPE